MDSSISTALASVAFEALLLQGETQFL